MGFNKPFEVARVASLLRKLSLLAKGYEGRCRPAPDDRRPGQAIDYAGDDRHSTLDAVV